MFSPGDRVVVVVASTDVLVGLTGEVCDLESRDDDGATGRVGVVLDAPVEPRGHVAGYGRRIVWLNAAHVATIPRTKEDGERDDWVARPVR